MSGPAVPLRLVTLDGYDGTHWTAPTSYAPLGATDAERVAAGRPAHAYGEPADPPHVDWAATGCPTPGWPTAISDGRAVVDDDTGTAFLATAEAIDPALGAPKTPTPAPPTT